MLYVHGVLQAFQRILTNTQGRHLARKHISWCQMRYPIALLPVNILTQSQLVRGVCPRPGDQRLLAVNCQEIRCSLEVPLPDKGQLSAMEP